MLRPSRRGRKDKTGHKGPGFFLSLGDGAHSSWTSWTSFHFMLLYETRDIFHSQNTMNKRDSGTGFNHVDTVNMLPSDPCQTHGAVDAVSQDQTLVWTNQKPSILLQWGADTWVVWHHSHSFSPFMSFFSSSPLHRSFSLSHSSIAFYSPSLLRHTYPPSKRHRNNPDKML